VVFSTLIASYSSLLIAVALAKRLGLDPAELQGSRFVLTSLTIGLFLLYHTVQALIVFTSQRAVHRRSFADLGFRAPVLRGWVVGFALGAAIPASAFLVTLATGRHLSVSWSVPPDVSIAAFFAYYCCFFVLFLNANSFGEELVFRCYPIEQFRGQPTKTVLVIVLSTTVFAAIHFIIGAFDAGWLARMLFGSILFSTAYLLYRSLWLVVGLHSGVNFVSFSLADNWKMGGLIELSGSMPPPIASQLAMLCTYVMVLAVMIRIRRSRPLVKAPAMSAFQAAT
jgi:membrane protease YdiL (CAAX protease family)